MADHEEIESDPNLLESEKSDSETEGMEKESNANDIDDSSTNKDLLAKSKRDRDPSIAKNSNVMPSREPTNDSRQRGREKAKATRTRLNSRTPSPSPKQRRSKVVAKGRERSPSLSPSPKRRKPRRRSPSPSSSSSGSSDSEYDSDHDRWLQQQKMELRKLKYENELLKIRLASEEISKRPRSKSPVPPTSDDDPENCPPPDKKRQPYFPKSEKSQHEWELNEEQRSYIQRFINVHYTDAELKEITVNKPPPKNVTFAKKTDTFVINKYGDNQALISKDQSFSSIQKRIGDVMGPLGKAWQMFVAIGKGEEDADVDLNVILENIEQAVIMLGQSINYISHQRRMITFNCYGYKKTEHIQNLLKNHLSHIENDPEFLFGEEFSRHLTENSKSDKKTDAALSKNKEANNNKGKGKSKKKPTERTPFPDGPRSSHTTDRGRTVHFQTDSRSRYPTPSTSRNTGGYPRGKRSNVSSNEHSISSRHLNTTDLSGLDKFKFGPSPPTSEKLISPQNREVSSRSKGKTLCSKLDQGIKRPKHSKTGPRLENSIAKKALPKKRTKTSPLLKRRTGSDRSGGKRDAKKRCHKTSTTLQKSVCKQSLSNNQKGRDIPPCSKSKKVEFFNPICKIQNGRSKGGERSVGAQRSYDKNRSQRCIFFHTPQPGISKTSEIQVEGHPISVCSNVFWNLPSSSNFYKSNESANFDSEKTKHTISDLFGRPDHFCSNASQDKNGQRHHDLSPPTLGISTKSQKVLSEPLHEDGIYWGGDRLNIPNIATDKIKNALNYSKMPVPIKKGKGLDQRIVKYNQDISVHCSSSSTCLLQYRYLQQQQIQSLVGHQNYNTMITLNHLSKIELRWWINNLLLHNGKAVRVAQPDLIMSSDAATSGGWGATCQGQPPTGGQWNKNEQDLHINVQEMFAAELALRCYLKNKKNLAVHLLIDNTNALSYLLKIGQPIQP